MAYAELEPFGPDAEAWRAGVIAATVANVNRDPKKRPTAFTPQDFMPEEPVSMTPVERAAALRAKFDAAMMAFGGRPRRPGDKPRRRAPTSGRNGSGGSGGS